MDEAKRRSFVERVVAAGEKSGKVYGLCHPMRFRRERDALRARVKAGEEKIRHVAGRSFIKRLVNIGDAKSLAAHPASTTHRQMTEEEQRNAGVSPDLIRLCVGIEAIDDIIEARCRVAAATLKAAIEKGPPNAGH